MTALPFSARLALALLLSARIASAADGPIVASLGDAYIAHRSGSDIWSIGSNGLELTIGFDSSRALVPMRLANPLTGRVWNVNSDADVSIVIAGERTVLSGAGSMTFVSASALTIDNGVRLDLLFEHRTQRLRITRSYACYTGSPTIETWLRLDATGSSPVETTGLVGYQFTLPAAPVRWLGGLRGDSAGTDESGAFYFDQRALEPGERLEIGSDRRSSEDFVPFFVVDGGSDHFYGGVMWSAGWSVAFERGSETMGVRSYFPSVITNITPQQPLEVPHTFFGLTATSVGDETAAMRNFVMNGIRKGRPLQPLVTYNTWFPYGTRIDEDTMVAAIDRAALVGAELFVLDAGWAPGAGENGDFDFESGLGTWTEDPDRFPSSLASLADYAHGVGMKFGLWVEAVGVALDNVDKPGLAREAWLATKGRDYGSPHNAQICLVRPEAREWVFSHLVELVRRVQPDYLKWDNNFWINCDRDGHGHGAGDGAFAHTRALYAMLAELRQLFPNLLIENVSGGGNRLDFGLLGLTDVAWMDDRTSPSVHVRHNIEGLTFAFPPAYLLSFVIDGDGEPIAGSDDLSLLVRSRMPGALGLTYRADALQDDTIVALAQQVLDYKAIRHIIADANATLLSLQAPLEQPGWDVLQELNGNATSAVIFAFKSDPDDGRVLVRPRGLRGDLTYQVSSLDAGDLGPAKGDVLMQDGIEIAHSGTSRAHVLVLSGR